MSVSRQLTFGFGAVIAAAVITGVVSIVALEKTVSQKDAVTQDFAEDLARVENLRYRAEQVVGVHAPDDVAAADAAFQRSWRAVSAESENERRDLEQVQRAWSRYLDDPSSLPARRALETRLDVLVDDERHDWALAFARSRDAATKAALVVGLTTLFSLAASVWLALGIRRRLHEQFRAREEVLHVVSHDLRNPLASIMLSARTAARRADAKSLGHFDRIHGAAERMNHLIEELVDTARSDSGTLKLARVQCDVPALVTEVVKLFEHQAEERQVTLATSLLPAEAVLDPHRVARVLTNLIGNALKFTPPGGSIGVRAEPCLEGVRISVSDTGPGVSSEQLPHLFEKHWQARRERGDGLGLGLYIAKSLVEAHGGHIDVLSTPGAGTTFSFTLPG